jgi:predicted Zn-dependent peptidase
MRRPTLPALLLILLIASLLPAPARADKPFFDPVRFRLGNGLEVWVQSRPGTPTVAVRLLVRVGSRYETISNNGISHFVEHMLFTGTQKWDEAEVMAVIDRLGGTCNGRTGLEGTWYEVNVRRDYFPQAMEWMVQVVAHPRLDADEMDDERRVIIQEQGGELGPVVHLLERLGFGYDLGKALRTALFPNSGLALNPAGTEDSLRAVDHAALLDYYHTYYVPNNMVLIVVGDISADQVRDLAQSGLGSMPPGPASIARPSSPAAFAGPIALRLQGPYLNDWAQLSIGYRTIGAGHHDRYALTVAAEVLSFRLNESVRYRRGLVYSIGAVNATFADAGYFQVWTSSEGENLAQIQPLVEAELERLRDELVGPEDLARARQSLDGRRTLWLETNLAQADSLVGTAIWLPPGEAIPDDFVGIDAVTAAEVQRVARAYFVPRNRYVALYRPAVTVTGGAWSVGIALVLIVALLIYRRYRGRRAAIPQAGDQ